MIKEVIVVEGRDDLIKVKQAVDADVIVTSGFGITEKTIERIREAQKTRGVIIFTDPDYAGEKIRRTISEKVKGCKHAYMPRDRAIKNGDIGVENASIESIRDALNKVQTEIENPKIEFTMEDIIKYGLADTENASELRDEVGKILGIGYGNAKQFLNRLNRYGIKREDFERAVYRAKEGKE
ncbi:MAG: rnmV [Caloramator sp.]|uniref:ribonuclease M5 n=1 Tax=unclassified Caloramator TaxID=2629145 RepID=UPI000405DDE0|nr:MULTISPECIES: ribonuclease M5 [unclassified Caloramator]MBZ4664420.1 rnmV [Caloramator sp.]